MPRGDGTRVPVVFFVLMLVAGPLGASRKFQSEQSRREEAGRLFDVAQAHRERGDNWQASNVFEEVADIAFDNADAQYHAGMAHLQIGALDKAQRRWEETVRLDPEHVTAMFNLGTLLAEKGDLVGATRMMERVIAKQPEDADNHKTLAILHFKQDLNEQAIAGYMRCIRAAPLHSDCYCGMGNSFIKIGRQDEALEAYTAAVNINPQEPGYLNNVGNLLVRHQRFNTTAQQLAIQYLQNAIELDGGYADGYFNLGEAYSAVHQHDQAMQAIRQAMKLDPERVDYKCTLHLDMRKLCDWSDFDAYTNDLERLWQHGTPPGMAERTSAVATRKPGEAKSRRREKEVTLCPSPLDALSYALSLGVLKNIALGHAEEARIFASKHPSLRSAPWPLGGSGRLRVGYVSIELRDRPVGKDMVHAFHSHNALVDVVCFSLNPSPKPGLQGADTMWWHEQMLSGCAGGFLDISGVAFTDAAHRINEERPHVLVNLDGWTSAPLINEIMILSPAPIQLNFKGFPGTTGVRQHHGLVSDAIVTPPDLAAGYVERLVMLPQSYHYNGHDRLYAHMYRDVGDGFSERVPGWPSREDLVQGKFMMPSLQGARPMETLDAGAAQRLLLCNFNQFYKIVPQVWAVWMKILSSASHATLWLLSWNEAGKAQLRRHAAAHNVMADRQLTFTTFFEERWHTAAKGVCDLFIDTFPYSSHGTAADALFAGVPVVTLPGESMASRVATSLSLAAGAGPALISRDFDDYYEIAQALVSRGRARIARLRGKQADVVKSAAFDSSRWGASYAQSLKMLWDAFVDGARATSHPHIVVEEALSRAQLASAPPAGVQEGATAAAQTATKTSPGASTVSPTFTVSNKARAASPPGPSATDGGQQQAHATGGASALDGADGFSVKSPAPHAPKATKYKVVPSFGSASLPSTPSRAGAPSFGPKRTGAGAQASAEGRKASQGKPHKGKVPSWPQQAGNAATSGSSAEQQLHVRQPTPPPPSTSAGGWAIPSRRTGSVQKQPPPQSVPAAPRSAPAWSTTGGGGGARGEDSAGATGGSRPKIQIPSW